MEKTFEQRVAEARAEVSAVTPEQANNQKTSNPDTLFIDPRDVEDIQSTTGIIPGALNLQLSELSKESDDALLNKLESRSRPIIAACQGGPMGALAAQALLHRGYENVFFIDGGTQSWLDAGYTTTH